MWAPAGDEFAESRGLAVDGGRVAPSLGALVAPVVGYGAVVAPPLLHRTSAGTSEWDWGVGEKTYGWVPGGRGVGEGELGGGVEFVVGDVFGLCGRVEGEGAGVALAHLVCAAGAGGTYLVVVAVRVQTPEGGTGGLGVRVGSTAATVARGAPGACAVAAAVPLPAAAETARAQRTALGAVLVQRATR